MKCAAPGDCATGRSSCTYPFASPTGFLDSRQIAHKNVAERHAVCTRPGLCHGHDDDSTMTISVVDHVIRVRQGRCPGYETALIRLTPKALDSCRLSLSHLGVSSVCSSQIHSPWRDSRITAFAMSSGKIWLHDTPGVGRFFG